MHDFVVFETTEWVLEAIWDVVVAFFIVRISLVYCVTAATLSGAILSLLSWSSLPALAQLTASQSDRVTLALQLLSTVLSASLIVWRYELPRSYRFRLVIGVVSVIFMAIALSAAAWILGESAYSDRFLRWHSRDSWLEYMGLLAAFGAMPASLMLVGSMSGGFEERRERQGRQMGGKT